MWPWSLEEARGTPGCQARSAFQLGWKGPWLPQVHLLSWAAVVVSLRGHRPLSVLSASLGGWDPHPGKDHHRVQHHPSTWGTLCRRDR